MYVLGAVVQPDDVAVHGGYAGTNHGGGGLAVEEEEHAVDGNVDKRPVEDDLGKRSDD